MSDDERMPREPSEEEPSGQEPGDSPAQRADAAIRAIASGANPGEEALALSNRFTDDATDRMAAAARALLRRIRPRRNR